MLGEIASRWPALPDDDVAALLAGLRIAVTRESSPAQMVTRAQLRRLHAGGVAIGSHGKSHTALPLSPELDVELHESRRALAHMLGVESSDALATLAFPYGMHSADVVERARASGYDLVFTLVPEMLPLQGGRLTTPVVSRANVSEPSLAPDGDVRTEVLALHFFRLPRAAATP